jgi:hypothetical protein
MPDPKRFLLRLDPELFEAIRRWAKDDLRSINAQIEYLLSEQARRAGRLPRKGRASGPTSPPADPADPADRADPADPADDRASVTAER